MMQPVAHMLTGNTQSGAVFHQAYVADIRYFGTANALVNPTYYVTENTLRIVIQFLLDFFCTPAWICCHWNGEDIVDIGTATAFQFFLTRKDIYLVVMQGVQSSSGWGWNPRGISTGHRMNDFGCQHVSHLIRDRPHTFTNLCMTRQTAFQTDIHVPIFIGFNPRGSFHIAFADHRACFH